MLFFLGQKGMEFVTLEQSFVTLETKQTHIQIKVKLRDNPKKRKG